MKAPESIEAALSRLMPTALSGEGLHSIETMLDELAGVEPEETISGESPAPRWRWLAPTGIAACAAILASLVMDARDEPVADLPAGLSARSGILLVDHSERIEEVADEGWTSDPGGAAMKVVWVRAIEEVSFRDERTGIIVHVTQPREEMVFTPITAF